MRLIVCGGRTYRDRAAVFAALDRAHAKRPITLLIYGGARGADDLAFAWAAAHGVPSQVVIAKWDRLGPAAGPERNGRMIREWRAEGVIAFPGGRGTADMVRQAEAAGLPVWKPYG